ncbi:MAG: hypothetical protein R2762_22105 [Bryobacteraceae bacterium]
MIQPLRRLHYRIWLILAILLPLLVAAAISGRRNTDVANSSLDWEAQ